MFKRQRRKPAHRGAVRKNTQPREYGRLVGYGALILVLVAIAVTAWEFRDYRPETVMPITTVAIEGEFENLSRDDMQARVLESLSGGYFTVDLDAIREALLQLPWVEQVSVRRQWPSALSIRVSEKRAVAYWGSDSLISDRGELFAPKRLKHDRVMPQLDGPDGLHRKVWQFAAEVSAKLVELGMRTEKVALDERRAWRVFVNTGRADQQQLVEINLGKAETEQRLERLLKVFAMRNAPDLNNVLVIDMRYPNGFAMRSKNNRESNA